LSVNLNVKRGAGGRSRDSLAGQPRSIREATIPLRDMDTHKLCLSLLARTHTSEAQMLKNVFAVRAQCSCPHEVHEAFFATEHGVIKPYAFICSISYTGS
jgi:hypothetical protein